MDTDAPSPAQPPREHIFNAPLAPVLLAASIPLSYFLQGFLPDQGLAYAFRPATLVDGGWWPGLLTSLFIHGGWMHALMNAGFALAFGPPVARLFSGARGVSVFFAYYIVCGVIGGLGYGLLHLNSYGPVAGASGAVFGLIGGAVRLLGAHGAVRPLTDRRVVTMTLVLMALNVVTGLLNIAPGAGVGGIAWVAHAFGYLAGLLLIGPLAKVFGRTAAQAEV